MNNEMNNLTYGGVISRSDNAIQMIKTDLLAIIKESKHVNDEDLTALRNTNVKVKKGREREFIRLCDNYYESVFNQLIENDTDTVTPVFEALTKEVEALYREYMTSEAYQFTSEVKDDIDNFKNLNQALINVEKVYELTDSDLKLLLTKRSANAEWQHSFDETTAKVKELLENSSIIRERMVECKNKINSCLLKYVEEQMKYLRDSFVHTVKGTNNALSVDRETYILANDKKEYDSLYLLSQILKTANLKEDIDDVTLFGDMMVVSRDQYEVAEGVLGNINLFTYLRKPDMIPEKTEREKNEDLIQDIEAELDRLEREGSVSISNVEPTKNGLKLSPKSRAEYDKLSSVLKYLKDANRYNMALTNVWDTAYVIPTNRTDFEKLINSTDFFRGSNPNARKKEQNNEFIKGLYNYLDELSNVITKHKGVSNLPIKSTKTVGDKAWAVTDADIDEANRIIDIINLVSKDTEHLYNVWGIANVGYNDVSKLKKLLNSTKKFSGLVPNVPTNQEEMQRIHDEIATLITKAKADKNGKFANDKVPILESDYELYKLLDEKYRYLEDAKASDDLEEVDNVKIDSKYIPRYRKINQQIRELKDPTIDLSVNEERIKNIKARIAIIKDSTNVREQREYNLLREKLTYLENALIKKYDLYDIDGVKILMDDVQKYLDVDKELENIVTALDENRTALDDLKRIVADINSIATPSEYEKRAKDIYAEIISILERSFNSLDLIDIDGRQVDINDKDAYERCLASLNALDEEQKANEAQKEAQVNEAIDKFNEDLNDSQTISEAINNFQANEPITPEEIKPLSNVEINEPSLKAPIEEQNMGFTAEEQPNKTEDLVVVPQEPVEEKVPLSAKLVTGYRKLKTKAGQFFANTRLQHIALGLGIIASVYSISSTIANLTFANNTLATTFPMWAGFYKIFNTSISPLVKVGIIGATTALGIKNYRDAKAPERLNDNERTRITTELMNIGSNLKAKAESFVDGLINAFEPPYLERATIPVIGDNGDLAISDISKNIVDDVAENFNIENKEAEYDAPLIDDNSSQPISLEASQNNIDNTRHIAQLVDKVNLNLNRVSTSDIINPDILKSDSKEQPIVFVPNDLNVIESLENADVIQDPDILEASPDVLGINDIDSLVGEPSYNEISPEDAERLAVLEEQVRDYTRILNETREQPNRERYQQEINLRLEEIEKIKGNGRGL